MSMKNPELELYVSVDIEADGPIPIKNSMLALGAQAFTVKDGLLDTFEINLKPLEIASPDPNTMEWWKTQPEAWKYVTTNQIPPTIAMRQFNDWVKDLRVKYNSTPIFVAFPATFDHMFVYVYSHYLLGYCEFRFAALDIKSYTMAVQKTAFTDVVKSKLPKELTKGLTKHNHTPLADAIGQAEMFLRILRQNLAKPKD